MAAILIVEDERSVALALRFELEEEGHEVYYTADFMESISAIKTFRFDLVICDVFIQNGNGIQLMNYLQNLKTEIPLIMMTAYPESRQAMKIKEVLIDNFFEKPFSTEDMKSKVNNLLTKNLQHTEQILKPIFG